jgi:hypothetical protein
VREKGLIHGDRSTGSIGRCECVKGNATSNFNWQIKHMESVS